MVGIYSHFHSTSNYSWVEVMLLLSWGFDKISQNKTKFLSVQLGKTLALTFLRIYGLLLNLSLFRKVFGGGFFTWT